MGAAPGSTMTRVVQRPPRLHEHPQPAELQHNEDREPHRIDRTVMAGKP